MHVVQNTFQSQIVKYSGARDPDDYISPCVFVLYIVRIRSYLCARSLRAKRKTHSRTATIRKVMKVQDGERYK